MRAGLALFEALKSSRLAHSTFLLEYAALTDYEKEALDELAGEAYARLLESDVCGVSPTAPETASVPKRGKKGTS